MILKRGEFYQDDNMLKYIGPTNKRTGVNLGVVEKTERDDVADAVCESLIQFYESEFLDDLVDKPFLRPDPELQGLLEYCVEDGSPREGELVKGTRRWAFKIMGDYLGEDRAGFHEIQPSLLGFVNLYHNLSASFSLTFAIRQLQPLVGGFKPDFKTSKEHAKKYLDFVQRLMVPAFDEPRLYIVAATGDMIRFDNYQSTYDTGPILLRKLRRGVDKRIGFPVTLLGYTTIIDIEVPGSFKFGSREVERKRLQWLYDFVENPDARHITYPLAGIADNSIRTMVYPATEGAFYEPIIAQLAQRLEGKREIVRASVRL